jgi:mannosyl-oligosaccharide alpha-1,2-mannosidase
MAMTSKSMRRKYGKPVAAFALLLILIIYLNGGIFTPSGSSWSSSHKIQHDFGKDVKSLAQASRQRAVRKEFIHAWTGYQDHGWMADSLRPLTGRTENQFCGWSATLVDALDTLWIMQLDEEFEEAVNATLNIDFDNSQKACTVNLFETTIRHLGGLIAAYDLSGEERLMPQIRELGNLLHSAFNTWNGMPCSHCALVSDSKVLFGPPSSIAMAAQGSLYLEFARLSQITENPKYMKSILQLTDAFARTQNDSTIPGLWPELVNPASVDDFGRQFSAGSFTYSVGALSDSTYEYLVKGHLMLGSLTTQYKTMWIGAARAIRKYILFRAQIPDNGRDLMFTGIATRYSDVGDIMFEPRTEHLGCFAGGMFGLAARVFNQPSDFVIGEALTNGCVWAYQSGPIGLMAETYTALPCPILDGSPCEFNQSSWEVDKKTPANCHSNDCTGNDNLPEGVVSVSDARYLLRPEAIESVLYYWRMTGDEHWRDVGWEMFIAVRKHTRSSYAHASIEDVMKEPEAAIYGGRAIQRDEMESFWFGETLKYFYLLFSEPSLVSLDDYVLNTEAHPFRLTAGARAV